MKNYTLRPDTVVLSHCVYFNFNLSGIEIADEVRFREGTGLSSRIARLNPRWNEPRYVNNNHHIIPFIHPFYTFIAIYTPMYTHYTCTHTIYTPNLHLTHL